MIFSLCFWLTIHELIFFKSAITSVAGTNINNLNQDILGNIMIPHYSIGIQKSIVAVLTSIDEKIAINNRINAELEAMAKTLYDYWFVQFDFPDANGKPYKTSGGRMEYNATLKREIPAGWAVNTLSQIANITMGQSPAGESYNEDGIGTLFFRVRRILVGFSLLLASTQHHLREWRKKVIFYSVFVRLLGI